LGSVIALVSLAVLASCSKPAAQQMPPPQVDVVVVQSVPIDNVIELPGRVQAVRTAEVRARVTGILGPLMYREGSDVRAGQPLFSIDPRELQANLAAVQATLQRAEASATNARQDVERYRPLLKDQAISKQEYDAAVARLNTAEADVLQARAQVANARLSLGYATVTAPIAGRAGRAQVTEGALVSAAEGTLLTTIEQISPVYVNFAQTSSDILAIRRDIQSGRLKVPALDRVQVELELEDGSRFSQTGRLDFLSQSLDESTSSASLRAEFPNPGGLLLPGQFVRARILAGTRTDVMLVPQRAVTVGPKGGAVLVVNSAGMAEARPVKLGDLRGDDWVVTGGLAPGDRVIVSGLQKVQPGKPVSIVPPGSAPASRAP
jgi:membrane fusion protein (multidrug efflux system)